jgi:DNA-binding NarL/FixJ family response regulator
MGFSSMKVLIGDDHRLFRDGIRLQLQEFGEAVSVVDAANFSEVFAGLRDADDMDLALIDLGMPGMDWREALGVLARDYPSLPVVVVSATDDRGVIMAALELGVAGYIPKTSSGEVMINALRLVLAGGVYLPQEILAHAGGFGAARERSENAEFPGNASSGLTPRQLEVLRLIADGKSNKEIGSLLGLSDSTVKTHISSILRTLKSSNRTQAILTASRMGILRIS